MGATFSFVIWTTRARVPFCLCLMHPHLLEEVDILPGVEMSWSLSNIPWGDSLILACRQLNKHISTSCASSPGLATVTSKSFSPSQNNCPYIKNQTLTTSTQGTALHTSRLYNWGNQETQIPGDDRKAVMECYDWSQKVAMNRHIVLPKHSLEEV